MTRDELKRIAVQCGGDNHPGWPDTAFIERFAAALTEPLEQDIAELRRTLDALHEVIVNQAGRIAEAERLAVSPDVVAALVSELQEELSLHGVRKIALDFAIRKTVNDHLGRIVPVKPMTDDEINAAWHSGVTEIDDDGEFVVELARAIEAHHGIGGKP